jgi:gliding motility-associated-like protein
LTVYDAAGCPAEDRILVEVRPNVYAPNVIKPDSADGNEAFTLFSKDALNVLRLGVYDRWGNLVFENRDFKTNDRSAGWNGTFRGKDMGPGVFVWMAEVELLSGVQVVLQGDLTLVR